MGEQILVKELFTIPEQIRKGDFVHKLAEGIHAPKETAESYVVTPALAEAFDKALRLVGSALGDKKNQAAYLHGSFGSGKSHFMALLSLLLSGNEEAWRKSELHPLREKHSFVGKKKLLELHFHMVGKESIESAIFGEYLAYLAEHHPEASVPPLFGDDKLFAMAERDLGELGDDKFFAPLNEGAGADARWGKKAAVWDRKRFESAVASTDPAVRGELFSALVKKRYIGWEQESRAFVDLDSGLAIMSRHAAELGYHAIILFLDELILWLAGRAADAAWLHQEAQKMVKLVEAGDMRREIPLVSFIARQRDLADMVGEEYAGAENARLRDSLTWWEGRYDLVKLEDKNLPAIVEKRILRAKDESARETLKQAFSTFQQRSGKGFNVLLGSDDAEAFRKLYPFSPALVDVLVALSNSLQRQRTAIKLLMEMLVEHIDDLAVGEVVRVGDLFDLLAAGEDSADGIMKARFDSARQMYNHNFLPMIREQNGTASEDKCQRLRSDHALRLGCAGCTQKACRTDNRLVKTLLVAALVPEVGAVKDLTASRLVELNHGSLSVPIPGTEASIVAQKLRGWAPSIGQLQVGSETDPSVRVRLDGVDPAPILEKARHADTDGSRQRVIRDLLFEALGVDKVVEKGKDHKVTWRGTSRVGHIYFGNVRQMGPEMLRCHDDHDWRLVVDYPFDKAQYGPQDDIEVVERAREEGVGSWTLVWLPSFFSETTQNLLGKLVLLEEVLQSREKSREYVKDLSVENQSRALVDLENMRSMTRARLLEVIGEAYGLARPKDGDLDAARSLEEHLHLLKPGAKLDARKPPNLAEAVDGYVKSLLTARYPRHPNFTEKLTKRRVEHLVEKFGQIIDSDDKKIPADKALVEEMRGTLGVLGLVRVTEDAVHLVADRTLQELEQTRQKHAEDAPKIEAIRRWLDENRTMGLPDEAEDLVVRCYARWSARTFMYFGKPHEVVSGKRLLGDAVLEKPELPGQADWNQALDAASGFFGISLGSKALHADSLKRFEAALADKVAAAKAAAAALPAELARWAELLGVAKEADRLVTARSADALCAALHGQSVLEQVNVLAGFEAKTSQRAVGKSLHTGSSVARALENGLAYGAFQDLHDRQNDVAGAAEVLEQARTALRQDELHVELAARLGDLAEESQRLCRSVKGSKAEDKTPAPPPESATVLSVEAADGKDALVQLNELTDQARAAIEKLGEKAVVSVRIVVKEREA